MLPASITQNPTPETQHPAFENGDRIEGRWEVCGVLKGGMGVVYIVYDHEHRMPYAAKTFRDDKHADNTESAAGFSKEALAWVNLDAHPNIARAEYVQTINDKPFLFLEYVSGGDLTAWIGTPRLTEDLPQVLRFALQFCDGMIHAAAKGIDVHRDIKPSNCLVTEDGTLKISDFGLAKVFDAAKAAPKRATESASETRRGTGAGTCNYMAPEQFDDVDQVDVRADIYSFGVLLFEMITGTRPFDGGTWDELKERHRTQPPAPLPASIPARLVEIVNTCLSKDPIGRFPEFNSLRRELTAIYEEVAGAPAAERLVGIELDASEWSNKGVSLSHLNRYAEAIDCYARALELNPRLKEAWNNQGTAFRALGRHPQALDCFERALALDPEFALAWNNKGWILKMLGRNTEEALACFGRALDLDSRIRDAWHGKGLMLRALGREDEAVTSYARALALDARNPGAWFQYAESLQALGRHSEAVACYDHALSLDSGNAEGLSQKGKSLQALGRHSEALACYQYALTADPNVVSSRFARWAARMLLSCQRLVS